jgi:hypothetical protein
LFELPKAVWEFLEAAQHSQRRQAGALELTASELSDVGTMLEEIRQTLEEKGEDPEKLPSGSRGVVSGPDGSEVASG